MFFFERFRLRSRVFPDYTILSTAIEFSVPLGQTHQKDPGIYLTLKALSGTIALTPDPSTTEGCRGEI